jgi:uncharacterized membrane protein YgdD (TMEM256/DUF423 family)
VRRNPHPLFLWDRRFSQFEMTKGRSIVARFWVLAAAIVGFLGVAAGALGAHALAADPVRAGWMSTGAQYALFHAVAVLALAALTQQRGCPLLSTTTWCFVAGSLLFSGSLWLMALGGPHLLVYATPLGGLGLLAGWAALAAYGWQEIARPR